VRWENQKRGSYIAWPGLAHLHFLLLYCFSILNYMNR